MRFRFSKVLIILPLLFAGTQAATQETDSEPIAAETEEKVLTFLERFVDAGKRPQEQAALFADAVEYYDHGIVDKAHILHDVERYVRHWPQRYYQIAEVTYMNADPASDRIFVAYTVDFEVANRARNITGKANYGVVIADPDGEPKVESIKERVTERNVYAASNP